MFHIVLIEPEIPPNTGNVIRLAANSGCDLHLVGPLGFELDDKRLRRAGLDYHEYTRLQRHPDFGAFLATVSPHRVFAFSSKAERRHDSVTWCPRDALVFGPETRGTCRMPWRSASTRPGASSALPAPSDPQTAVDRFAAPRAAHPASRPAADSRIILYKRGRSRVPKFRYSEPSPLLARP